MFLQKDPCPRLSSARQEMEFEMNRKKQVCYGLFGLQADSNVRFEFILGVDLVEEPPQDRLVGLLNQWWSKQPQNGGFPSDMMQECAALVQQILNQATSRMFITSCCRLNLRQQPHVKHNC